MSGTLDSLIFFRNYPVLSIITANDFGISFRTSVLFQVERPANFSGHGIIKHNFLAANSLTFKYLIIVEKEGLIPFLNQSKN